MNYVGHSDNYHDAGLAVISDKGEILIATHAERYTKLKFDRDLTDEMWNDNVDKSDYVTYYADPYLCMQKNLTRNALMLRNQNESKSEIRKRQLMMEDAIHPSNIIFDDFILHHKSHAATAYYTRPWESKDNTVILTIDGMGEYQTAVIYDSDFNEILNYNLPKSIGDFYSICTRLLGYVLLEEEYIVMGLASYGKPTVLYEFEYLWENVEKIHGPARLEYLQNVLYKTSNEDFASSLQKFTEIRITELATEARKHGSKLCYAGGVAQNIVANSLLYDMFDEVWIPPAPNDGGSALGAAAWSYCKQNKKDRINFTSPYLGYNIDQDVNVEEVVDYLLENKVCGVANGRAEWGPRALGNRSLLGDVRFDIQDTVNKIKKRELFRPFAPAILEEYVDEYFEGPYNEYMQYASIAKDITKEKFPSIVHVDGTARVQVVKKDCESVLRQILEEYYKRTGVPLLLNTSLNIKGQPILNDEKDCEEWEQKYGVKIFGYK